MLKHPSERILTGHSVLKIPKFRVDKVHALQMCPEVFFSRLSLRDLGGEPVLERMGTVRWWRSSVPPQQLQAQVKLGLSLAVGGMRGQMLLCAHSPSAIGFVILSTNTSLSEAMEIKHE